MLETENVFDNWVEGGKAGTEILPRFATGC